MSAGAAADDVPVWVFLCDYCAELVPIGSGVVRYTALSTLADGSRLVVPTTYCGSYCASRALRLSLRWG